MSKTEKMAADATGMLLGVGWEDGVEIHRMAAHLKEGLISVEQLCQFTRAIYERAFPNDVGTSILTESVAQVIGTKLRLIRECFEPAAPMPMQADMGERHEKAEAPAAHMAMADQHTWDKICSALRADVDGGIGMTWWAKPGEPMMVIIAISTDSSIGRMRPGDRSSSLGLIEGYLMQMTKMIPSTYDAVVVVLMAEPDETATQAWQRANKPLTPRPAADLGQIKPMFDHDNDLELARIALLSVMKARHCRERVRLAIGKASAEAWADMERRHVREIGTIEGLWR